MYRPVLIQAPLLGLARASLQDVVRPELLHVLPAVLGPEPGLRGVRVLVEQPVARRLRLGRHGAAVQLAPGADGHGPDCAVRQWWVPLLGGRGVKRFPLCSSLLFYFV